MIAYLPHTEEDIKMMLDAIGITDIEQLFADIPRELTLEKPLEIPCQLPRLRQLPTHHPRRSRTCSFPFGVLHLLYSVPG